MSTPFDISGLKERHMKQLERVKKAREEAAAKREEEWRLEIEKFRSDNAKEIEYLFSSILNELDAAAARCADHCAVELSVRGRDPVTVEKWSRVAKLVHADLGAAQYAVIDDPKFVTPVWLTGFGDLASTDDEPQTPVLNWMVSI
jgi:hypothetical protein